MLSVHFLHRGAMEGESTCIRPISSTHTDEVFRDLSDAVSWGAINLCGIHALRIFPSFVRLILNSRSTSVLRVGVTVPITFQYCFAPFLSKSNASAT